MNCVDLRKKVIEKYFSNLNDMQFEAVVNVNGPTLILAGAGSGKTTVLINRIVNMIKFADSYTDEFCNEFSPIQIEQINDYLNDKGNLPDFLLRNKIAPWEIMAITFTNKAAQELKDRISLAVGESDGEVWASTFHSTCARILRVHGDKLGYDSNYTIYDSDDQKRIIKDIMKSLEIDEKFLPWKTVQNQISRAKDSLVDCDEFEQSSQYDIRQKYIAQVYKVYSRRLKEFNAMDFDDLIFNTVKLFQKFPEVLDYYQNRFKYIMIDEYQDTNYAQFMFAQMLVEKRKNICVVGDDDQSIYKFRGATIENILNFEKQFENTKVIRLEQNYRSTQVILDAANNIIKNNLGRKAKTLWTDKKGGDKIVFYTCENERDEARFVCDTILDDIKSGIPASAHAVLYRMNAQSNALENAFLRSGINYRVYGSMRFFDRKEIKDILAYLSLINNYKNGVALMRIINEPKRGIGAATLTSVSQIAEQEGISLFEVVQKADGYEVLSRAVSKLKDFAQLINELIELSKTETPSSLFELVLSKTGYDLYLKSQGDEGEDRLENVKELLSSIIQYEEETDSPSLSGFLEQTLLLTDMDTDTSTDDRVVLMTMHSAKGLEFPVVFVVGCEEGLFPSSRAVFEGPEELEEERRLAYVAVTRAKEKLYLTNASVRMLMGKTDRTRPSRFVMEIPEQLIKRESSFAYSTFSAPAAVKTSQTTFSTNSIPTTSYTKKPTASTVVPKVGNTVRHKAFGIGMVVSVSQMGNDYLLEIAFESVGTKKIMNNFAKLEIL